jgi:glycosyltransferase involved in cell wall biosynthesis
LETNRIGNIESVREHSKIDAMKIGIIGTRGIPNQYGGFEQFAMFFSQFLVEQNHEVVVYNSSNHDYTESKWNGVKIVSIYDPEKTIGSSGQFIYDFLSILNARKQNFDVVFQLGYTSSSIWGFLFPKKAKLITNMDGLEWKRSKYSSLVQKFLSKAEKWAVKQSDVLIADSKGIQDYLSKKYNVSSHFVPYGANLVTDFDQSILKKYGLKSKEYNIAIARMEPENNIDMILDGHARNTNTKLIFIGNTENKFGQSMKEKYKDHSNIEFLGAIYDQNILDNLRYFSQYYFHGHSVGGTNPSLLEAMACQCSIIAHKNQFNESVLGADGQFFYNSESIEKMLSNKVEFTQQQIDNNSEKIKSIYSFENVHGLLQNLIVQA